MQQFSQNQLTNHRIALGLTSDEVTLCEICGVKERKKCLAICNKYIDGEEHSDCMKDKLNKAPDHWICEDCMVKSKCQESKSPVNLQYSHARKRRTQGTSSSYRSATKSYNTLLHRGLSCKTLKIGEAKATKDITSKLQISSKNSLKKVEGPNANVDKRCAETRAKGNVKLNSTRPPVVLACPAVFEDSSSGDETKATKRKYMHLSNNYPEIGNVTVSRNVTIISGPVRCKLDGVKGCGQVDCTLPSNSHGAHKEKKSESWKIGQLNKAVAAMKIHEMSPFEAITLSKDFPIPNPNYRWRGKFQIQRGEGITSTCVWIQAHVSTQNDLAVVDRLPEIIVLEELPRLRMWSSQFMESIATKQDILYFFAYDHSCRARYRGLIEYMGNDDLALKGSLDGAELLIFSSNLLPKKFKCWKKRLFLWGVFWRRQD